VKEEVRARLAEVWTNRAISEHQATYRFEAYAKRMEEFGVSSELAERTHQASADELRHKEICLEVAARFGARAPKLEPYEFRRRPDGREILLSNVVATCCVTETLNTPFLALSLEITEDLGTRTAVRELLKDEVNHGKLGWAYLAWARRQGEGATLQEQLPEMLMEGSGPSFFVQPPEVSPHEAELARYGDLSMAQRQKIFFDTTENVIFPGLEANGISTELARAWVKKPVWREH
jgi:hypothetical protein